MLFNFCQISFHFFCKIAQINSLPSVEKGEEKLACSAGKKNPFCFFFWWYFIDLRNAYLLPSARFFFISSVRPRDGCLVSNTKMNTVVLTILASLPFASVQISLE